MNVEYEIDGINESIDRSETVIKLVPSDQLERILGVTEQLVH